MKNQYIGGICLKRGLGQFPDLTEWEVHKKRGRYF